MLMFMLLSPEIPSIFHRERARFCTCPVLVFVTQGALRASLSRKRAKLRRDESKYEGRIRSDKSFTDWKRDKNISVGTGFVHFDIRDAG